jgi:SAM-dependent methyltransferase
VNLIDAVPDAVRFIAEAGRVLERGGIFLMSDPYCWDAMGGTTFRSGYREQPSDEILVSRLRSNGLETETQRDMVPWLLRHHSRKWECYFCHCVGGIKKKR